MVQDLSKIAALLLFSLFLSLDQHYAGVPAGAAVLEFSSGARYAFYYVHLIQSIYHSSIVFCLQLKFWCLKIELQLSPNYIC